jgi:hypothetical protein
MRTNRLIFALFSAAILFSMVREWSAQVACARTILIPPASAKRNPLAHRTKALPGDGNRDISTANHQ